MVEGRTPVSLERGVSATFPIYHGMVLGRREPAELQWLIDHGVIQSDLYRYLKIIKISDDEYCLVKCEDSRYYPEPKGQEQARSGAGSLQTLIEVAHLNIEYWYWYGDPENEPIGPDEN